MLLFETFFNVTENDDLDKQCQNLTRSDINEIRNFCKAKKVRKNSAQSDLKRYVYPSKILNEKSNPTGWICAQTRPAQGLYKVAQYYRTTNAPLPDYLFIVDDDTYINFDIFRQYILSNRERYLTANPSAIAGCLIRISSRVFIPYGGYGLFLNKGTLTKLFLDTIHQYEPCVNCNSIRNSRDTIGEINVYQKGMTLVDLIYAYATKQPFSDYRNWNHGFCAHSDWIWGYFIDYYKLSSPLDNPNITRQPGLIEPYQNSMLHNKKSTGTCQFSYENCNPDSPVCHYVIPHQMKTLYLLSKSISSNDTTPTVET